MMKKLSTFKSILVAVAIGGIPLVTNVSCDPYYGGFNFFRDDDSDYYYDDGYYYDYYYEPYCDPFYCY